MATRSGGSLRRRLLTWLLLPLVLVAAVILWQSYRNARAAADKAYDRLLAASALAIADRVVVVDGMLDVDLPYVALEMLASSAQDRVFYRIAAPDGTLVTGYADLPPAPPARRGERWRLRFYDAVYRGEPVRVVMLARPLSGPALRGDYTVQVAQTRGERAALIGALVVSTAVQVVLLVLLVAALTWLGVRKGLTPLAVLSREIRRRSPQDLRPLEAEAPREVQDLVTAVDGLMARLADNLNTLQSFISDASHQLRTPLAALQAQAELALRRQDAEELRDTVARLLAITRRTSRLAEQLLSHARSTPDPALARRERLDLSALSAEVTRDVVPAALEQAIDLGLEAETGPVWVQGDPLLLGEALRNLLDNALHYCPDGAQVTVRLAVATGQALLDVDDNGPGIDPAERERVFQRFYRVPGSGKEGCGLGLAIVRTIIEGHGGTVSLHTGSSGQGLRVQIALPLFQ